MMFLKQGNLFKTWENSKEAVMKYLSSLKEKKKEREQGGLASEIRSTV